MNSVLMNTTDNWIDVISNAGRNEILQINLRQLVNMLNNVPDEYRSDANKILHNYPKACSSQLGFDIKTFSTFILDNPHHCIILPIRTLQNLRNHNEETRVVLSCTDFNILFKIIKYYVNINCISALPKMKFISS